jgi:hypothetical protein
MIAMWPPTVVPGVMVISVETAATVIASAAGKFPAEAPETAGLLAAPVEPVGPQRVPVVRAVPPATADLEVVEAPAVVVDGDKQLRNADGNLDREK